MANKKIEISNAQKLGIGVGLTTAAVAAVGAYFLYGSKNATKNRKKVKSWGLKAKGEVLSVLEKAEKITEGEFKDLVDKVARSYEKVEKLSKRELSEFKDEMAANWQDLVKSGVAKVFHNTTTPSTPKKAAAKKAAPKKASAKKAAPKKAAAKKAATSTEEKKTA